MIFYLNFKLFDLLIMHDSTEFICKIHFHELFDYLLSFTLNNNSDAELIYYFNYLEGIEESFLAFLLNGFAFLSFHFGSKKFRFFC
jgi:hypothetical protein